MDEEWLRTFLKGSDWEKFSSLLEEKRAAEMKKFYFCEEEKDFLKVKHRITMLDEILALPEIMSEE